MTRVSAIPVLFLLLGAGLAQAAAVPSPIQASRVWSRPATPGLPTGVAYMTLVNHAGGGDRLVSASSPKAARVSLHRSSMSGGVMSMAAVDGLDLPPGRPTLLAPNGYHLMLSGLKGGLKVGETYPVTLRFAHAKPLTVQVQVRQGPDPMVGMTMK